MVRRRRPVDLQARRRFVGTLLAAALAPSLDAHAQQPGRVYRVAVFFSGGSDTMAPHRDALRERLSGQGFIEGRNLQIIWRGGIGTRQEDREVARELVAARPDAILAFSSALALAAQWATKSIPIVFAHVSDPIAEGVVKDYARPGGNTTGASTRHAELQVKRLELLRELLPKAKRVAFVRCIVDPSFVASQSIMRDAAARLGLELIDVTLFDHQRAIEEKRAEAIVLYCGLGARLTTENIIRLAAKLRIASIFPDVESVSLGGLASYGTDPLEDTRLGADQLVRVLKGARPGELAVDQSSRFVLAINLKTARALGITIPQSVLLRAERLVEQ
jgi:putative ABC transport system substrate-binding protein